MHRLNGRIGEPFFERGDGFFHTEFRLMLRQTFGIGVADRQLRHIGVAEVNLNESAAEAETD